MKFSDKFALSFSPHNSTESLVHNSTESLVLIMPPEMNLFSESDEDSEGEKEDEKSLFAEFEFMMDNGNYPSETIG